MIRSLDEIRQNIPEGAEKIRCILEDAGYRAVFVGGCVRDLLLDRPPLDWDIGTSAPPDVSMRVFPHNGLKVIPTGLQHGTITVLWEGAGYEVTVFRTEGEYSDRRRPDSVLYTDDLVLDLSRRDFTINAMAWEPAAGLIDPHGGQKDLAQGLIRTVGDPDRRFSEDALRMMRAIRFAARLGFTVVPETLDAIAVHADSIIRVSAERISAELALTITGPKPEALLLVRSTGLMNFILPELETVFERPTASGLSVGIHTVRSLCLSEPSLLCRMAALLQHVDHTGDGRLSAADSASIILRRLRFSTRDRVRIVRLLSLIGEPIPGTRTGVRFWLSKRAGEAHVIANNLRHFWQEWKDLTVAILQADASANIPEYDDPETFRLQIAEQLTTIPVLAEKRDALTRADRFAQQILDQEEPLTIASLAIDGRDAARLGLKGMAIRQAMNHCLQRVLLDPQDNRRDVLLTELNFYAREIQHENNL